MTCPITNKKENTTETRKKLDNLNIKTNDNLKSNEVIIPNNERINHTNDISISNIANCQSNNINLELVNDRKSIPINNEIFKYFPVEKFYSITSKYFER